jgi:hypothetical protein
LARVVTRIAIECFFDHFPAGALRLQPDAAFEQVPTYFEYGPRRIPVERAIG